jgi:hypothetical protein
MKKRVVTALIIISLLIAPLAAAAEEGPGDSGSTAAAPDSTSLSSSESYNTGLMRAKLEHSSGGWVAAGLISGGLFSWLGTGITVLIASGSDPSPNYIPEEVKDSSYIMGYKKEAKRKNVRSAAIPGVIMSSLWTVLVISAASAQ